MRLCNMRLAVLEGGADATCCLMNFLSTNENSDGHQNVVPANNLHDVDLFLLPLNREI